MSKEETKQENSEPGKKIKLRLLAIEEIDKKEINVLECYSAKGHLWKSVRKKINKTVNVHGIEIDKNKKNEDIVFYGDNRKIVCSLDLSKYDLIDLDAFGDFVPLLKVILKNKTYNNCPIVFTFIVSGMGTIGNDISKILKIYNIVKVSRTIVSPKTNAKEFINSALFCLGFSKAKEYEVNTGASVKVYGICYK